MPEFSLFYRGPLRSNGDQRHKHQLRLAFHSQLKTLWGQPPLDSWAPYCLDSAKGSELYIGREVENRKFAPLVCEKLSLVARLDICMLRPEPPGRIVNQGGDIDNRLKTLFDSLRMPCHAQEVLAPEFYPADSDPFFTLLEDDNLITHVGVRTERLLEPCTDPSEVILLIDIVTRVTRHTFSGVAFGSS